MQINLGCGSRPKPGYINVEMYDQPGVDVVHDLDVFPWPFEDNTADRIEAFDVYEHVEKPLHFMAECWRILKPEGILYIHTAYWKNQDSYRDPTHKRFLTEESFDYWIPGTYLNERYGIAYAWGNHFSKVDIHLDVPGVGDLDVTLRKIG